VTDHRLDLWREAVVQLVESGHQTGPSELAGLVAEATAPTGVAVTVYLVDYEQLALRPLPPAAEPLGPEQPTPEPPQPVDDSPAGQAFTQLRPVEVAGRPALVWIPIVNGTERLGVLRMTLPDGVAAADVVAGARIVAGAVGHLVSAKTQYGDALEHVRRSRPMSAAAELLRGLLPPLTFASRRLVVSAVLEPCYDVGGDAFDYAVDHDVARLAVFDAVGRGMPAALAVAATFGAVRAARRAGGGLQRCATAADQALTTQFADSRFVTAVLADLDLAAGRLSYVNAGHPLPVLMRHGMAVRPIEGGRRTPLGVGSPVVEPAVETFEPGDRLLLYTDGVTEARDPGGALFGLDRFVALAERVAAEDLPVAETVRRLSHAVIVYQDGRPRDDATIVLVEWSPDSARRSVP
jgi:sigma-B regulation protein RsbU (phosphoserine phosphatase)